MKQKSIRIPLDLYSKLCERAAKEHRTLSGLIIHLLTQALQEQKNA